MQRQQELESEVRALTMKECTFRPATSASATRALIARLLAEVSEDDPTSIPCSISEGHEGRYW